MLDLLPRELIIEVLHLLPAQSLLALTLTSKLFNAIISESSQLSESLELFFVPENKLLPWTGSRRYSKVYLEGHTATFYRDIFLDLSVNLKELHIICLRMEGAVLKDILMICEGLRNVLLKDNRMSYKKSDFDEPLPRLELDILNYRNFTVQPTEVFKILKNCQVRDLKVVGFTSSCEELESFIKNQRNLQALAIHDADKTSSMFSTSSLDSVNFRLSKLVLDKFPTDCGRLKSFVHDHRQTIQQVELNEVKLDVLDTMKSFTRLRRLKIFEMYFKEGQEVAMPSVEQLTIGYDVEGCWARNFPNVKELKVSWIRFRRDLAQIQDLKRLERLKIQFCCIPELELPTVRHLRLSDVGYSDERPFKLENNKIEELELEHCTHAEWLAEFLEFHAGKLRLLRIKEMELSEECWRVVERCRKNFVLQIYNKKD